MSRTPPCAGVLLRALNVDQSHPSLRIKRIQGSKDIFEMTIKMSIRVTWQYTDNRILLRNK
ncbi:hypothetical protein CLOSBL3_11535 [Clostridiaceae bacterium BL-3]|jgi:hypothetical protein|nr:hypothetical protein CLOSBL3_11535 [Clostridiaceae bacterium BL-3]